ncbi:hypothetical protein, partial [Burkholderia gladioli]|uniref:hypothetical protein n=1 Tax=Burkholderia gladioli TaxID=28095 RepID=UPI0019D718E8
MTGCISSTSVKKPPWYARWPSFAEARRVGAALRQLGVSGPSARVVLRLALDEAAAAVARRDQP